METNNVIDAKLVVPGANSVPAAAGRLSECAVMSPCWLQVPSLPLGVLPPGVEMPVMVLSLLLRPITSSVNFSFGGNQWGWSLGGQRCRGVCLVHPDAGYRVEECSRRLTFLIMFFRQWQ